MPRFEACRPVLVALSLLGGAAGAETPRDDWPQFRGPSGDGISPARNPPLVWSESRNVAWKVAVPGLGRSSPVILGDRIWLTTAVVTGIRRWGSGADDMQQAERAVLGAVCLDRATGRILWHVDLFPWDKPDPIHWLNSYATPTPAVEPGRLYCDFGTFGTACIDSETGKELWKRRLPLDHQVGPGSSPLLHGDLLVLVRDGRDQQYVTALDRRSGETVWKASRPPIDAGSGDLRKSFSTAMPIEVGGRAQIVVVGAQWIVAYEPETGKEVWRVDDGSGFSVAPRPVHGNGMVYVCTGNTGGAPQLWAIRPDGLGDVTSTHVVWKLTVGVPMVPSPVLVGTRLFLVSDNGFVACVDALTGEIISKQRAGGSHCASPVWASGRLYVFRDDGKTLVLRADETLEILAENQLEGSVFASPAFVGSRMIFRTDEHLYAIEETPGGAIPDQFPAEGGATRTLAEEVYVIEEPRRTRDQLRALDAILPGGTFPSPDDRWRHLAKTLARLQGGKPLHVVNLGDSIVNDTARSGWVHRLRERYPRSAIRMTTVVRGSTGCWWYKEEDRVRKIVVPLEPDLVFIGGLSQRGDADSIRDVVQQLRAALPEVDVLLGTAAFGRMDPLREATLPGEPCSGYGEYGARLRALAEELGCGFVDVTRGWADYIRRSGWPTDDFKRDSIHANDRGEQILGRILDAHLSAPEG